jgi:hypothetical protein
MRPIFPLTVIQVKHKCEKLLLRYPGNQKRIEEIAEEE